MRSPISRVLLLGLLCSLSSPALAQEGATLTPDRSTFLISKIVGGDRWTIGLNLLPADRSTIANVTGTILKANGDVLFVTCLPRTNTKTFSGDPQASLTFAIA